MKRYLFLYFVVLTIPLFLGLNAWQSNRYIALQREIKRLEEAQAEWVESNRRLIAGIAVLSSPERIENIARKDLGLKKIEPEDVLQVKIGEGKGIGL
ncbi:MAG: septum formation initiator family protein [Treponema sp.]|jgi:cell division protein FtsL|nr:septum formation initiator family protein [Treponema sp.]